MSKNKPSKKIYGKTMDSESAVDEFSRYLCGRTLYIKSEPGAGATAVFTIPKEERT